MLVIYANIRTTAPRNVKREYKGLTLSGPHSITITTHEAYIPAAPSLEEMQMLKMSQANATK